MKFNFKIQPYQTDAVDAVVKVFAGPVPRGRFGLERPTVRTRSVRFGYASRAMLEMMPSGRGGSSPPASTIWAAVRTSSQV